VSCTPSRTEPAALAVPQLVLDTNIVLDLYVFQDPATAPLRLALQHKRLHWIATPAMREELACVLAYPHIARRQQRDASSQPGQAADPLAWVLAHFDAQVSLVAPAAKARVTCRDPDDQKFIDLAVAHQALLLSKDQAVLCMKKRLLALGVQALTAINLD